MNKLDEILLELYQKVSDGNLCIYVCVGESGISWATRSLNSTKKAEEKILLYYYCLVI